MKALSGLGRNDVIRVVALVSVVAFPLIANAALGRSSGAVKASQDVAPVTGAAVKAASAAARDSCADQHWPFFSAGCLRGSAQAVETRLVSMNAENPPNSTATDNPSKIVRATETDRDNAPSAKPKKTVKPRIATHMRERKPSNATYAVNTDAGHISMPGW
jgi:hypothetical protein